MNQLLPVLWVCGVPGVGKSTIAWEIAQQLRATGIRTGNVDIDQLGICYPEQVDDAGRNRIKARNLGAVVQNFRAAGAGCLVMSGVIEAEHVPTYVRHTPAATIVWCLLRLDPSSLRKRLIGRGWDGPLQGATMRYSEALESSGFAQFTIDTTGKGIADVVGIVRRQMNGWPLGHDRPVELGGLEASSSEADAGPIPVLWVCGPTAVGKSAVAWQVFQRVLAGNIKAGFVDLAQVGVLLPSPPNDPENHLVKARNLAAIRATYRRAGAQCLVVSGSVGRSEVVRAYASLLPAATPLTVCRLRAGEAALADRVMRRVRGLGWAEPGDGLRDLHGPALGEVVQAVLIEDRELERIQLGDLRVDTDGFTVEEVAQEVLERASGWRELFETGSSHRTRR